MSTPLPVRPAIERAPRDRPQNIPTDITPAAIQSSAYYNFAFASGLKARFLSVWAYLWWLADQQSAPVTGAFSTAFSSAFDGGVDSPQGTAFSTAYSSAFS